LKGQNREINNYANWSIGLQSTFNPTPGGAVQSTPISEIALVGFGACGRKLQSRGAPDSRRNNQGHAHALSCN